MMSKDNYMEFVYIDGRKICIQKNRKLKYFWWSQAGSNRRPPACKAGALPAELWPQKKGVD